MLSLMKLYHEGSLNPVIQAHLAIFANGASGTKPAKVILVGDRESGKTSVVKCYLDEPLDDMYFRSDQVDFRMKRVRVNGQTYNLHLWDIPGQDEFVGLKPAYYDNTKAAVIVVDATKEDPFREISRWKRDIENKITGNITVPIVVFANKWDNLGDDAGRKQTEFAKFCGGNHMQWFTTSAKSGLKVDDAMSSIIGHIEELSRPDPYRKSHQTIPDRPATTSVHAKREAARAGGWREPSFDSDERATIMRRFRRKHRPESVYNHVHNYRRMRYRRGGQTHKIQDEKRERLVRRIEKVNQQALERGDGDNVNQLCALQDQIQGGQCTIENATAFVECFEAFYQDLKW